MVYKKYIKRGGKIYGPYIYHSKRVDGKVVSEYHGPKKRDYKKFVLAGAGVLVLAALVCLVIFYHGAPTGNAILNFNANYQKGQPLSGQLGLSLQQGELIPADSKIVFDNNGNVSEYPLSSLTSEKTQNGSFYVSGSRLSGSGEGYGIPGRKTIYPEVQFTLDILSSNQSSANSTNNSQQENKTPGNMDINESMNVSTNESANANSSGNATGNSVSGFFNSVGNLFLGLNPTGNAVLEYQSQVQGSVSAGGNFTYVLQDGQRAELSPLSVFSDGNQLPDNAVRVETVGNKVIVTTNYSESSSGFGPDYTGTQTKDIVIDLSGANYMPSEGSLNISLVENESEIISLSTVLKSGTVSANKTVPTQEPIPNETDNTGPLVLNSTGAEAQNFAGNTSELTQEEKDILTEKIGNYSVKVGSALQRNGLIVVRYELGDYWIEDSYPANIDKTTLKARMKQDVIKWQKDLAARFSVLGEQGQNITGLLENFSG